MGASPSSPSKSIPINSVPNIDMNANSIPIEPIRKSGIRVTGNVIEDVEKKIEQAYMKGKEEGAASFNTSLETVAASVYDKVHGQLIESQEKSINESLKKADEMREKIKFPEKKEKLACVIEEEELLKCLKSNKSCLDCDALVKSYASCAATS